MLVVGGGSCSGTADQLPFNWATTDRVNLRSVPENVKGMQLSDTNVIIQVTRHLMQLRGEALFHGLAHARPLCLYDDTHRVDRLLGTCPSHVLPVTPRPATPCHDQQQLGISRHTGAHSRRA